MTSTMYTISQTQYSKFQKLICWIRGHHWNPVRFTEDEFRMTERTLLRFCVRCGRPKPWNIKFDDLEE